MSLERADSLSPNSSPTHNNESTTSSDDEPTTTTSKIVIDLKKMPEGQYEYYTD